MPTTMAALAQALTPYDADRVHGYRLTPAQIAYTLAELRVRPLAARRRLPGLHPDRADVIVAGALVLRDMLEWFAQSPIIASEADLLWAAMLDDRWQSEDGMREAHPRREV